MTTCRDCGSYIGHEDWCQQLLPTNPVLSDAQAEKLKATGMYWELYPRGHRSSKEDTSPASPIYPTIPNKRGFPPDEGYNRLVDELTEARAEVERLKAERLPLETVIVGQGDWIGAACNLLAVLHRDGGHHTGEVGFAQSCKDGMQAWWDRAGELDHLSSALTAAEATIAELRAALAAAAKIMDEATKWEIGAAYRHSVYCNYKDSQPKCNCRRSDMLAWLRANAPALTPTTPQDHQ